jgi:hypothetical protein
MLSVTQAAQERGKLLAWAAELVLADGMDC